MLSECSRAIWQSSETHDNGANPFSTRAWLVFSNARRSIGVALPSDDELVAPASTLAAMSVVLSADVTRRDLENTGLLTGFEIRRATGWFWISCANALWQIATVTTNKIAAINN